LINELIVINLPVCEYSPIVDCYWHDECLNEGLPRAWDWRNRLCWSYWV